MLDERQTAKILVVDDEPAARISLAEILRLEGHHVLTAASGEEALCVLAQEAPVNLAMLDIRMPGMDGLEVLQAIRTQSIRTVVVLLTGFGTLDTAIEALRHGAHDYLLKPCGVPEILRSVHSGLARYKLEQQRQRLVDQLKQTFLALTDADDEAESPVEGTADSARFLTLRHITLDRQNQTASMDDRPLDLTPTEFKILQCLMSTSNQVWSAERLIEQVQGYETDPWGARAIVRVHIRRLRKKLEVDASNPSYILNVRGVGYLFSDETE